MPLICGFYSLYGTAAAVDNLLSNKKAFLCNLVSKKLLIDVFIQTIPTIRVINFQMSVIAKAKIARLWNCSYVII